ELEVSYDSESESRSAATTRGRTTSGEQVAASKQAASRSKKRAVMLGGACVLAAIAALPMWAHRPAARGGDVGRVFLVPAFMRSLVDAARRAPEWLASGQPALPAFVDTEPAHLDETPQPDPRPEPVPHRRKHDHQSKHAPETAASGALVLAATPWCEVS